MKTMLIEIPINGNITPFEIERARCNRMEYTSGMKISVPKMTAPQIKVKKVPLNAGIYNFIIGCLP